MSIRLGDVAASGIRKAGHCMVVEKSACSYRYHISIPHRALHPDPQHLSRFNDLFDLYNSAHFSPASEGPVMAEAVEELQNRLW